MHIQRVFRSILLLVLAAWLGGISDAHAAPQDPAPGSQGRILFILASSKVHGKSTLPASISFGEVVNAWDTFQAAGYAVDFVSPDGGAVPILDAYVGRTWSLAGTTSGS